MKAYEAEAPPAATSPRLAVGLPDGSHDSRPISFSPLPSEAATVKTTDWFACTDALDCAIVTLAPASGAGGFCADDAGAGSTVTV